MIRKDPCKAVKAEYTFPFKLHKYQDNMIRKTIRRPCSLNKSEVGYGKEQRYSEPILTPTGWTTMGDLNAGDKVISKDGNASTVLTTHEQGIKDSYKIEFLDGSTVHCGINHLWVLNHTRGNRGIIRDTQWVIDNYKTVLKKGKTYRNPKGFVTRLSVDLCKPVEFEPVGELPLHPYVLGVLLGDGSFRNTTVKVTLNNKFDVKKLEDLLPPQDCLYFTCKGEKWVEYEVRSKVKGRRSNTKDIIISLGLYNKLSVDKHIPQQYLFASVQSRKDLLQGLLNTDGHCQKYYSNLCEYSTSSLDLKCGAVELCRGLGIYVRCSSRLPKYTYKGQKLTGKKSYRVNINFDKHKKTIVNVTKESPERSRCITVDHPSHTYITTDYTVTHNSAMAIGAALYWAIEGDAEQILILCPPILIDQWVDFIEEIPEIDSVCAYRGTPAQRRKMDLEESVLVMSYNIFRTKADWKRIEKIGKRRKLVVIADELSCKSLKSLTYRKMKLLIYRKMRIKREDPPKHFLNALNATPISSPLHVYNWCALMAPGIYYSKKHFDDLHISRQDQWGNVTKWQNEDSMRESMDVFSFEPSVKLKLPPITYSKVPMAMSNKHEEAYRDLVNAELEKFDVETRALAVQSMFSTLQRACILPSILGLEEESPVVTYLLGLLDQIEENDQLLIFTRHTLVTEYIAERLPNCATIYGGTKDKAKVLADSKSGKIREIVANIDSGGHGLNLQHFKYIAWAEFPFRGDKWTQGVGRMWRMGQTKHCHVFAPYLKGTIQERLYHRLLKNDDDICRVLTTKRSIRSFLQ